MSKPVNSWQDVLYDLCFRSELVSPKRIAFRLHKAHDYISDICRRDRVDPLAVFNVILQETEPLSRTDVPRFAAISQQVFRLLIDGTHWIPQFLDPALSSAVPYRRLCEQTGVLLEDLGGVITLLASIEEDGVYDEQDDVRIEEFLIKRGQFVQRLNAVAIEVNKRRAARVQL